MTATAERVFGRIVNEMGASPRRQVALVARSWAGACVTLIDHWLQVAHDLSADEISVLIAPPSPGGTALGLDDSVAVVSEPDIVGSDG